MTNHVDFSILTELERGKNLPHQARLDSAGTLHHIIVRGIEKRRIVDDNKDWADFVNRMGEIASDTGTTIYA